MTVRQLIGDCRTVLRTFPDGSVHMVKTSPPYLGQRDYGNEPSVWGGSKTCEHEWGPGLRRHKGGPHGDGVLTEGKRAVVAAQASVKDIDAGAFCAHCDAWRGSLGLEPTPALFVDHMVEIFEEIRRVLRDDGTLWLNMGDGYAGGGNGGGGSFASERANWREVPPRSGQRDCVEGLKAKDLVGMPWMLAFALRSAGWFLRQDIIWAKPNPMPESISDRCTKSHEYVFLLSKQDRYFFDAIAIAEPAIRPEGAGNITHKGKTAYESGDERMRTKFGLTEVGPRDTRNKRSVWTIPTSPFSEAHFATFPPALVEPCILAGTSARGVCRHCAAPWQRVVRKYFKPQPDAPQSGDRIKGQTDPDRSFNRWEGSQRGTVGVETLGWYPECGCDGLPPLPAYPPRPRKEPLLTFVPVLGGLLEPAGEARDRQHEVNKAEWRASCEPVDIARGLLCDQAASVQTMPATVLDPFGGAGTTGLVADRLGRDAILIELNPAYAAIAERRLRVDLPLFAPAPVAGDAA